MKDSSCKVALIKNIVDDFLAANDELCSVCRRSFNDILDCLNKISGGEGTPEDLELIRNLCGRVGKMCRCSKGSAAADKVAVLLLENEADFNLHIKNRVCPAGECASLILAPCQSACPAGIDIPNYIAMVGKGEYDQALALIKEDVPMPGSLGRICEHPCQSACRRALVDQPIAICALKRVAYDKATEFDTVPAPEFKYTEKVAVIGAGPAGLSAAYFLAQIGYRVTIFEAMPEPGGMLAYGIPPYRLPREILRREINNITNLGVTIKTNSAIKSDAELLGLKARGFSAIFIGTGAWKGSVPLPGCEGIKNVLDGVTFLRTINAKLLTDPCAQDDKVKGKDVVVIGGGNVAIDAARVSLRLGANKVTIIYRRTREEMPALIDEIEDAEKEGINFQFLVSPQGVKHDAGEVNGLECIQNKLSEPDETGRRRPVPMDDSLFAIKADLVIFATGQKPDLPFLNLQTNGNKIAASADTLETSVSGVFAGGDAVTGPASAIKAMAAGKQAAQSIHYYLRGWKSTQSFSYPVKRKSTPPLLLGAEQRAAASRINAHELYQPEKTNGFEEVMACVSEEDAMAEAGRCLRCDICSACGSCEEVCRSQVGADAIRLNYAGKEKFATDFKRPGEKCIGCGTCSVNCPTGAITLKDEAGFREMRMCGYLMSKNRLLICKVCGKPFATEKHLEFIRSNVLGTVKDICPECTRKSWSFGVFGQGVK